MTEDGFWKVIAALDWEAPDADAAISPLIESLARLPVREIESFQNHLADKLYALDTVEHARNVGRGAFVSRDRAFSGDSFLYARCAVVAQGRRVFEDVRSHPCKFPKDAWFEAILYVAMTASGRKTGKECWHIATARSYETFSNADGWRAAGIGPGAG